MQVFIDNILVYSKNEKEHEGNLRGALICLRENQLYGKLLKCSFFQKKIHYLEHIISGEDISKVKAIMDWPVPKSAHKVYSFMGLVGCYRRFMEGFLNIAKLIHYITLKGG